MSGARTSSPRYARLMRALALSIAAIVAVVGTAHGQPAPAAPPPTPWLGITYKPAPPSGWLVVEVHPDTPAAAAGLRTGDVILGLRGAWGFDLGEQIRTQSVGALTEVLIDRDGRDRVARVRLAARPSPDELVHRTLFGRALPRVVATDRTGRVDRPIGRDAAALAVFDARCARCVAAVNQLDRALAAVGAPRVRALVLCDGVEEFGATLTAAPMAAAPWRIDREVAAGLLAGLEPATDGALVVTDRAGVVRYAAAISSDGAVEGAAAAMANQIAAR